MWKLIYIGTDDEGKETYHSKNIKAASRDGALIEASNFLDMINIEAIGDGTHSRIVYKYWKFIKKEVQHVENKVDV